MGFQRARNAGEGGIAIFPKYEQRRQRLARQWLLSRQSESVNGANFDLRRDGE